MHLKKLAVRSVAAVSASVSPLVLSATPASAESLSDSETIEWTFMRQNGEEATCTVRGSSWLGRPGDSGYYYAGAGTSVTDTAETPCEAQVGVRLFYIDKYGNRQDSTAYGLQEVSWNGESSRDFNAYHRVRFLDCIDGGERPCDFWVLHTYPK